MVYHSLRRWIGTDTRRGTGGADLACDRESHRTFRSRTTEDRTYVFAQRFASLCTPSPFP